MVSELGHAGMVLPVGEQASEFLKRLASESLTPYENPDYAIPAALRSILRSRQLSSVSVYSSRAAVLGLATDSERLGQVASFGQCDGLFHEPGPATAGT